MCIRDRHEAEEIVKEILSKYDGLPDITREEVLLCLEDIRALEKAGKLFSADIRCV